MVRRAYCGLLGFLKNLGEGAACPQRVLGALISGGESGENLRLFGILKDFSEI